MVISSTSVEENSIPSGPSAAPPTTEMLSSTETTSVPSTHPPTTVAPEHSLSYVLVPLGVIIMLVAISGLVFFLVRKKRLDRLRHHLMPLYNFDPSEEGEDWEAELLEEGMDHRNLRKGYKSMEFPSSHNAEHYDG